MSGKLRQAAKKFADSTMAAAQSLRWAVQVKTTTNRETTGLVEVERVGTGDAFWAQVRNSVYLADNDLIWVVKDASAQGNWIFAGFVTGAGTGESLNNSPIPSVATPVLTSPDGTPLIIRPVAGQQGTIGRAGETFNFAGAINVTQGVTFAALGAGIVQSSAGGVLSSDYLIDAGTEINAATADEPVLILQTTDDNATNPILDFQNAAGNTLLGVLSNGDIKTDRWLNSDTNTLIGVGVAGANNLSHSSGSEGWFNTAFGGSALHSNTIGSDNVAIGYNALNANTTGSFNMAIGQAALLLNTTGEYNTVIGRYSLSANITGGYNVAIGGSVLRTNTGSYNVGIGHAVLYYNTTGTFNMAIGHSSSFANTTGSYNIGVGSTTLYSNTTGAYNTAIGGAALRRNTIGNNNIGIGFGANYYNQEGSNNVLIGYKAGDGTADHNKSGCIFIGYQAGYYETGSNKLYIGNSQTTTPLIYGEFDNTQVIVNGDLEVRDVADLAAESLSEGDFATHAKWDVTNDITDDVGNKAEYTWSANQTSTLTQTDGGNLAIDGVADSWYKFVYTVAVTTAPDGDLAATITTSFAATVQTLKITAGTHTLYFKSAATPTDFIISIVSGDDNEGQFSYDDLSLKQVVGGDLSILGTTKLGDGANYTQVDNVGDVVFVGGAGLVFGTCYGNHIGWQQAAAAQNTWYNIADADMTSGPLHNVTHDGNGKLTVTEPGMYLVTYSVCFQDNAANDHVEAGIEVSSSGAAAAAGQCHLENKFANEEEHMGSSTILDLADNATLEVCIRTTDAGNPTIDVQAVNLTCVQVGGT